MNCREFVDAIAEYSGGELSAFATAAFQAHLQQCESCRAYLDSYCKTVTLIRDAHREAPDSGAENPRRAAVSPALIDRITDAMNSHLFFLGWPASPASETLYFG